MQHNTRFRGRRRLLDPAAISSASVVCGSSSASRSPTRSRPVAATRTIGQVSLGGASAQPPLSEVRVASQPTVEVLPAEALPASLIVLGGGTGNIHALSEGKEQAVVKLEKRWFGDAVGDGGVFVWCRVTMEDGVEVYLEACLSLVGRSGRVHVASGCKTKTHKNSFFDDLPADVIESLKHEKIVYLTPCKGEENAFKLPMLFGSQILDEDLFELDLTNKRHTTQGWIDVFIKLYSKWTRRQVASLGSLGQSHGAGNRGETSMEVDSLVGLVDPPALPPLPMSTSGFAQAAVDPPRKTTKTSKMSAATVWPVAAPVIRNDLEAMNESLQVLHEAQVELGQQLDNHVQAVRAPLVERLNEMAEILKTLVTDVGDADLLTATGATNLVGGLITLLEAAPPENIREVSERLTEVEASLEDVPIAITDEELTSRLSDLVAKIVEDSNEALTSLWDALEELPQSLGENNLLGAQPGGVPSLPRNVVVETDEGSISLVALLQSFSDDIAQLKTEMNAEKEDKRKLTTRVQALEAAIRSRGGVSCGLVSCASKSELEAKLRAEILSPTLALDVAKLFVEVVTAYAFQVSIKVVDDQVRKEKKAFKDTSVSDEFGQQFILLLADPHMAIFTGNKEVVVDKKLLAFDTMVTWLGVGGRGGRLQKNEALIAEMTKKHNQAVDQLLLAGSDLALLANFMMAKTGTFLSGWHAYIHSESQRLPEVGFAKEALLLLISDQTLAIMEELHKTRVDYPTWSKDVEPHTYLTEVVWVAMKTHTIMAEMTSTGFASHPAIVSTFMQHLTAQATRGSSAKLLDDFKRSITKEVDGVRTEIAKAKVQAVNDSSLKLSQAITDLVRKNPSIKK